MTTIKIDDLPAKVSFRQFWAGRKCAGASIPVRLIEEVDPIDYVSDPRPRVLGLFFHEFFRTVLELNPCKEQFPECVREIFGNLCSEYASKEPSVSFKFDPTISQIYESVRHHSAYLIALGGKKRFEEPIVSHDQSLWGIPDLVAEDGSVLSLVDFKLAASRDRLSTEKNINQVAFYSYLIKEVYGSYPSDIRLMGLKGTCLEVPFDKDLVDEVVGKAKSLFQTLQRAKRFDPSLEEISTPSKTSCNSCPHNQYCGQSLAKD